MSDIYDASSLERFMRETIPLARAIDVRVIGYDGYRLALAAPLAPNVNDKGCAFGGSSTSLLLLAGWGLTNLKMAEAGLDADVYVQENSMFYLAPVWGEMVGEAYAPEEPWDKFFETLRARGRARILIESELTASDGAGVAARSTLRFVAKSADAA